MRLKDIIRAENVVMNYVLASANKSLEQESLLAMSRQIFDILAGVLFGYYRGSISKN